MTPEDWTDVDRVLDVVDGLREGVAREETAAAGTRRWTVELDGRRWHVVREGRGMNEHTVMELFG